VKLSLVTTSLTSMPR